jgi:hypothetical protein
LCQQSSEIRAPINAATVDTIRIGSGAAASVPIRELVKATLAGGAVLTALVLGASGAQAAQAPVGLGTADSFAISGGPDGDKHWSLDCQR